MNRVPLLLLLSLLCASRLASAQSQDTVTYYHTDAIGSVRMITNASQQVVARYDYWPFGDEALPADPVRDPRLFAGKERDTETEFDYFGGRYYTKGPGRFTTVDPALNIDAALTDPQRWNRYAYARNNPLVFTDPDGREIYRVITPWEQELMRMAGALRDRVATALGADSTGAQHPLGVFGRNVVDSLLATVLPRDNQEYADTANAALLGGMVPMGGRFLGTTYTEAKTLVGAWGKGTFRTLSDTIGYHFEKHGGEVGAENVLQYLRKAFEFGRNLKGATKKFLEEGAIRYEKSGRYIIKDAEGNILSYGMIQ
jgi:RHS repeat-associated protein